MRVGYVMPGGEGSGFGTISFQTFRPVPEPGHWLAAAAAAFTLTRRRRRPW